MNAQYAPGHCVWCGKPLPKRRRKYCSQECDVQYFRAVVAPLWWDNAKTMALERAAYKCGLCGKVGKIGHRGDVCDRLEVHHKEKAIGSYHNNPANRQANLIVLCRACHEKAHHPHSDAAQKEAVRKIQGVLL